VFEPQGWQPKGLNPKISEGYWLSGGLQEQPFPSIKYKRVFLTGMVKGLFN